MKKKATDWFDEVPCIPDPWQEAKPKLTTTEIKKAAKVYKTFVDPKNQAILYRIFKDRLHKQTFSVWWKLVCGHNKNPVDNPYTVDQYIEDKKLGQIICEDCYCGACDSE